MMAPLQKRLLLKNGLNWGPFVGRGRRGGGNLVSIPRYKRVLHNSVSWYIFNVNNCTSFCGKVLTVTTSVLFACDVPLVLQQLSNS
jgi:hypothetical protein